MDFIYIISACVIIAIVAFVVILTKLYVKAPPHIAYVLSGVKKEPRILIGQGGFRIPFFERKDEVFLGQVTVDVKTQKPVPTHDFIDVNVDAVCKVRVIPTDEGTRLAAKNFLSMSPELIAKNINDSLEGNMREVIGAINLIDIITDRDKFSDEITKKAGPDMAKLGLEIISCNIQNVWDGKGLISDMGADNTYAIKKSAAITKANAEKEIEIAEAEAKKLANDAKVKADTEIAERKNELLIRQAELKTKSDIEQAKADAAYEIQKQAQQKTINIATVDAQIEQAKKEQNLSNERIKIKENELKAEVNAQADANKYQTEVNAQATLEKNKRDAESRLYVAQQVAEAKKAEAEAAKYAAEQEAMGIRAKGEAEAYAVQQKLLAEADGIKAKGIAEAEAMTKKAEAYEKYGNVAIIDMLTKMNEKVLPEVAKYVAEPMSKIGNVTIYGTTGNEAAGIAQNVPTLIKSSMDVLTDVTGVDMKEIVKTKTLAAQTDKNINIKGDDYDPSLALPLNS